MKVLNLTMKALNLRFLFSVFLACLFFLAIVSAHVGAGPLATAIGAIPTPTETPAPILKAVGVHNITVGEKLELSFKLVTKDANGGETTTEATGVKCEWTDPKMGKFAEFAPPDTGADSRVTITSKFATPGISISLLCSQQSTGGTLIQFEIAPKVPAATFTIEGSDKKPNALKLIEGQTIVLNSIPKGVEIFRANGGDDVLKITGTAGGPYTLQAFAQTTNPIMLKAKTSDGEILINGKSEIPVTIAHFAVDPNATITLGTPLKLSEIVTSPPADFVPTVPLNYATSAAYLTYDDTEKEFTGVSSIPETTVNITNSYNTGSFSPGSFKIKVADRLAAITIHGNGTNNLFVGGARMILSAEVRNADGNAAVPQPAIVWDTVDSTDKQYVSLSNQTATTVEALALKAPSDSSRVINIRARLAVPPPDGSRIEAAVFPVFVRGNLNVVDFTAVTVRIDMLDGRTSKDLFGPVAAKDYHVAKIRIVNDIKAEDGAGPASSVIFFSDALEVRVALEKKGKEAENWTPLTAEDIYYVNNWDQCDKTKSDIREVENAELGNRACDVIATKETAECDIEFSGVQDRDLRASKVQACKATVELRWLACRQRVKLIVEGGNCPDGDFECKYRNRFCQTNAFEILAGSNIKNGQWIPFRPYIYQVVANTHDRRDERSVRSRLFLGASIVASGTSFFTSFLSLNPNSDLPLALDKYQNLLVPTMGKLFPSMREVFRQNIISEVLPPLVEIPYGSDVSKYVFFPKKKIEGILPDQEVRITSISSHNIQVKVGIVKKGTVTQVQQ